MSGSFTVLVVDDDSSLRALVRAWLSVEECVDRILEEESARAGLAAARDERPDVVVLDHHMPELNGLDALPLMRSACDAHIIMYSSNMTDQMAAAALSHGADEAIVKSADSDPLTRAVRAVWQSRAGTGR